jgi:hypothetical protein
MQNNLVPGSTRAQTHLLAHVTCADSVEPESATVPSLHPHLPLPLLPLLLCQVHPNVPCNTCVRPPEKKSGKGARVLISFLVYAYAFCFGPSRIT